MHPHLMLRWITLILSKNWGFNKMGNFKNFDTAKKYALGMQEEKPAKPAEPAVKNKKPADEILVDRNGISFLQNNLFKNRKDQTLNVRITAETKANIDYLSKIHYYKYVNY